MGLTPVKLKNPTSKCVSLQVVPPASLKIPFWKKENPILGAYYREQIELGFKGKMQWQILAKHENNLLNNKAFKTVECSLRKVMESLSL